MCHCGKPVSALVYHDTLCFKYAVIVIFLMLISRSCKAASIITSPQSVVVFQSEVHVSQFLCEAENVGSVSWIINGRPYNNLPPNVKSKLDRHIIPGPIYRDTLKIPATPVFNGTIVQCFAVDVEEFGYLYSLNATLSIQGALASVENIILKKNIDSINISWSAPFSLDVSGVDPDIWYTVVISNVTDENRPSAVPCADCHNFTQTHYIFSPHFPSPCHKYNFTLIPQNGVGNGTWTERIIGYHTNVPPGINSSEVNITVSKINTTEYSVSIRATLLRKTVLCFGEHPDHFIVYYSSDQQNCPRFLSTITGTIEMGNIWKVVSSVHLGANCHYTVHIMTQNEAGETNSTGNLSISTTVILANVDHWNDGLNVTCIFSNTLSEKCYVLIVTDALSGFHEGEYLEGEERASHSFTGVLPGTYTVLIYGLDREEVSFSPPDGPDYITVVSVSGPQETPVPSEIPTPNEPMVTTSSLLCAEGLGIGAAVGVVTTTLVLGMATILLKCSSKCSKKKVKQKNHVVMERNMAYELHNPLSQ